MFRYQNLLESWLGYALRPTERGEVKIRCVNPEHEDKHPSCSVNCDTGLWFCFPCGQGGNLYQLAKALGKTAPNQG